MKEVQLLLLFLLMCFVGAVTCDDQGSAKFQHDPVDVDGFCSNKNDANLCEGSPGIKFVTKIKDWWSEMAIQKPVKCKAPKKWIHDSPILKLFSRQMPVISYPCAFGELMLEVFFIKNGPFLVSFSLFLSFLQRVLRKY